MSETPPDKPIIHPIKPAGYVQDLLDHIGNSGDPIFFG